MLMLIIMTDAVNNVSMVAPCNYSYAKIIIL